VISAPVPARTQAATAAGSAQLAQIAVACPDPIRRSASSRSSMYDASPAPPAVGLSPESLMKNGRSGRDSPFAMHDPASPAGTLKSKAARASQ
jgi:hypothetical protein